MINVREGEGEEGGRGRGGGERERRGGEGRKILFVLR